MVLPIKVHWALSRLKSISDGLGLPDGVRTCKGILWKGHVCLQCCKRSHSSCKGCCKIFIGMARASVPSARLSGLGLRL